MVQATWPPPTCKTRPGACWGSMAKRSAVWGRIFSTAARICAWAASGSRVQVVATASVLSPAARASSPAIGCSRATTWRTMAASRVSSAKSCSALRVSSSKVSSPARCSRAVNCWRSCSRCLCQSCCSCSSLARVCASRVWRWSCVAARACLSFASWSSCNWACCCWYAASAVSAFFCASPASAMRRAISASRASMPSRIGR